MTPLSPSPPSPLPPGDVARTLHLPARVVARVAAFDRRVDKEVDRYRNPTLDRVMYLATELGDYALIWHLVGVARGLRSDRHAQEALRLSVVLGGESLLVNGVIKSFFRPGPRASPRVTPPRRSPPLPSSARTTRCARCTTGSPWSWRRVACT
jgi:hypothetical protein